MSVYFRTTLIVMALMLTSGGLTISLDAQSLVVSASRSDSLALPLPPNHEPSPDTGRMLPRIDWALYKSPAMCLSAMRNIQHLSNRQKSALWKEEYDTSERLSAEAQSAARNCGSKFSLATIPEGDLLDYLFLASHIGDTSLTSSIIDQQLSFAKSTAAKGNVLRMSIEVMLDARPVPMAILNSTLQRLDSLGRGAIGDRIRARISLAKFAEGIGDFARQDAVADTLIELGKLWTDEEMSVGLAAYDFMVPYDIKIVAANFGDPTELQKAFAFAAKAARDRGLGLRAEGYEWMADLFNECCVVRIGAPVGDLKPNYAFAPGDKALNSPIELLSKNKRTVLLSAPEDWRDGGFPLANFLEAVRVFHVRYGDLFNIVVITKTVGYSGGSLTQTLDEEVESIRHFFLEKNKLSATIAVYESEVHTLPDGRRQVYAPVSLESIFPNGVNCVILDRNGRYERLLRPGIFDRANVMKFVVDKLPK